LVHVFATDKAPKECHINSIDPQSRHHYFPQTSPSSCPKSFDLPTLKSTKKLNTLNRWYDEY